MDQAAASCEGSKQKPVVICRGDGKKWLAIMPLEEWMDLAREVM